MKIKVTFMKRISSERNFISKHFQRCDSYCLFTQINFKHVSELGNLSREGLAFFEVKQVEDGGAIGILLSRNYFYICSK